MHSSIHLPAISTVHAVLYRRGLVRNGGRPRYKAQGTPLSHAIHPNDLWCADYKGEFMLADKRYCYPLTITADEIVNGWNPAMTYSDSPRESAEPDFINSFLQTMPARAWLADLTTKGKFLGKLSNSGPAVRLYTEQIR